MWRWACIAWLVSGCIDGVDLEDRPCPCIEGWVCDGERCVRAGDAATDAPADARISDATQDVIADAVLDTPPDVADDVPGDVPSVDANLMGCERGIGRAVIFCDDFEAALAERWISEVNTFGTATRELGASGRELAAVTSTSAGEAAIRASVSLTGELWMRAQVEAPMPSLFTAFNRRDAISLGDASAPFLRATVGDERQVYLELDGSEVAASRDHVDGSFCLRLHVRLARDATGFAELYLGTEQVASVVDVATVPGARDATQLWIGIVNAAGPTELRVDDVAIDAAELSCP